MKYINTFETNSWAINSYLTNSESDELINLICHKQIDELSDSLKKYKKRNVNINFDYNGGFTPLDYSILHLSGIEIIKLLIEYGADVNRQNQSGVTPLMFAAGRVKMNKIYFDIVLLLIKYGANFNIEDNNGMDFLDYLPDNKEKYICDKFKDKCEKHILKKSTTKYNL